MALYIGSDKVNIGSGIIPTEEKTVTAGTDIIEVIPSSGKYLSKVTINPMKYNRYYTGMTAPSPSLGSDGDIYLMGLEEV